MKGISVRFNADQAGFLKTEAKARDICSADYVRELIERQMKEGHFFEYFKAVEDKIVVSAKEKKQLVYSLMTCKLMEQLVLNQEEGQEKRDTAYRETQEWLEALKVRTSETRTYKVTLLLYSEHIAWLNEQAKVLQKSVAALIRKIVFLASKETAQKNPNLISGLDLSDIQKAALRSTFMTGELLKTYIESAYEGAEPLIKSCYENAEKLYNKLYITT